MLLKLRNKQIISKNRTALAFCPVQYDFLLYFSGVFSSFVSIAVWESKLTTIYLCVFLIISRLCPVAPARSSCSQTVRW